MHVRAIDGMAVVITGASAGIGRSLAEELSKRGARLVLAARRLDRLEALNAQLGGGHHVIAADVSKPADCAALVRRAVEHLGRIDTLVCNAGYGILRPVADTSADEFRDLFQTNVFGTTDCLRAAVPVMRGQEAAGVWRGQLVIVTSAVARRGIPYFGAYSATKAAQLALAEALRVELRGDRIAVTTVHPIGTDTEFGDVSAGLSHGDRPRTRGEVRQSAQTVARAIVRGIERPRPEVWPAPLFRWALAVATLVPSLVDRALSRRLTVEPGA